MDTTAAQDSRRRAPQAQIWRLDHPELGVLTVAEGTQEALCRIDPGFAPHEGDMAPGQRGLLFRRGAAVLGRASAVAAHRVGVCSGASDPESAGPEPSPLLLAFENPRIVVETDWRDRRVSRIRFHDEDQIADFQAPEGSWAARRQASIEASPWKRAAYPLAAGLGKSGLAILGIVAVPLLLRLLAPVLSWLAGLIPALDLPLPSLPRIDLPELSLPRLPQIDLPLWAELALDWSKVWVPLLLGIALAIGAVRRARRAERTREQWERDRRRSASAPSAAVSAPGAPGTPAACDGAQSAEKCERRASSSTRHPST